MGLSPAADTACAIAMIIFVLSAFKKTPLIFDIKQELCLLYKIICWFLLSGIEINMYFTVGLMLVRVVFECV